MKTVSSAARMATTVLLVGGTLAGCAPLLVGGAMVGGGLVVTDRRTTGTQIEDEGIELKAAARIRELATLGHVNVTSFNRMVLITGEVPGEYEKRAVSEAVGKVDNVRTVVNELGLGPNSTVGSRSLDSVITSKVKATLVDAKDVQSNAVKVVTERAEVFLMGRVTERESDRSAELARAVSGVQKVVRVFEVVSEDELASSTRTTRPATPPRATAAGAEPAASAAQR